MILKSDVLFRIIERRKTNKSVSEILESLPLKIFSSNRILLRKIDLSCEKLDNEGGNEQ